MSIRLPSAENYAAQVQKEQKWLPFLAPHLSVRIPKPLAMGNLSKKYPWYWSVYQWIEEKSANTFNVHDLNLNSIAKSLALFLNKSQKKLCSNWRLFMKFYFPTVQDLDDKKLQELCDLINSVYFVTESVLIDPKIPRTTIQELKEIISKNELILAELNGVIIGCVKIKLIDKKTLMFGMLVAHPEHRSQGIGKKLILFVENFAQSQGYQKVCLELLTPKNWIHSQKEIFKILVCAFRLCQTKCS